MANYCEAHRRQYVGLGGCPWCLGEAAEAKAAVVPVKSPEPTSRRREVRDAPRRLLKHGGDRRSDKFQRNAVTLNRGNTAAYLLARLDRDRPDLAALRTPTPGQGPTIVCSCHISD